MYAPDTDLSKRSKRSRAVGALFVVVLSPVYLLWRTTTIGEGWMLALSIPLLWAEAWSVVQIMALRHQVSGGRRERRVSILDVAEDEQSEGGPHNSGQDLEVVVVVDQSTTMVEVERTVVGLRANPRFGAVTILSDQDRREELSELQDLWPDGIVRIVDAGSQLRGDDGAVLEAVMSNSSRSWVLWLDAGQVPMTGMADELDRRVFDDRVAVCQLSIGLVSPQTLVHVLPSGDEDALERRIIGPSLAERGLAPWLGSGSLVRRTALETLTADAADPSVGPTTSLVRRASELKRDGWWIDYEPRPLLRVPSPDSLHPYLVRRRRTSLAALEQLGLAFTLPGMTWRLRRAAMASAVSVTHGLRQLGVVVILAGALITGTLPIEAESDFVLAIVVAFHLATMFTRRMLSCGLMAPGDWIRHGWRTLGADIGALTPRFSKPLRVLHPRLRLAHRGSLGRMQLLTLIFVGFELALAARALNTLHPILLPSNTNHRDLAILLAASIATTIGLFDVLGGFALDQGQRRNPRIALESPITVGTARGAALDITPIGVGAVVPSAPPVGVTVPVHFTVPGRDGSPYRIAAEGTVRTATAHESGSVRVGLEFDHLSAKDRMAITEYCVLGAAETNGTPVPTRTTPDQLTADSSEGHVAMVRALATLSVVGAVGAMFLGPAAEPVSARETAAVPEVFTATDPLAGANEATVARTAGVSLRLHTDSWSEPLATAADGVFARGSNPATWIGPVHLEVAIGEDRLVVPMPDDGTVVLAAVEVSAQLRDVDVMGPGGRWRSIVDGDVLVPGPYTVRWSGDGGLRAVPVRVGAGEILRIDLDGPRLIDPPPPTTEPTEPPTTTAPPTTAPPITEPPSTTAPPTTEPPTTTAPPTTAPPTTVETTAGAGAEDG